jgi:hypothetical protein
VVVAESATEIVQSYRADLVAAAVTIQVIFLEQAVVGTALAIIIKAIQEAEHPTAQLLLVALVLILGPILHMQAVVVVAQAQQDSQVSILHTTAMAVLVE